MTEEAPEPGPAPEKTSRWDGWSITAGLLLVGYLGFALFSLFSPSDDPQRGMAQGFTTLAALILVSLGALLWFGVSRRRRGIVRVIFAIALLPALSPIARLIYLLIRAATGSRDPR
jgi:4-amino-4-deoxy-L-arabinose transferase-like glycosyltransferase